MKCQQIHLGCLFNLLVGTEWLPSDRSSSSSLKLHSNKNWEVLIIYLNTKLLQEKKRKAIRTYIDMEGVQKYYPRKECKFYNSCMFVKS